MNHNLRRIPASICPHIAPRAAQTPGTIQQAVEDIGVAGVDAGGINAIATCDGHEVKVPVIGIAEEGIGINIAFSGPAALDVGI